MQVKQQLLVLRRHILGLLPEFIWPTNVILDGVSIPVRGRPYSYGTKWLLKQGGYELEERTLLSSILKPGMQVLEMGSSIGILTAIMAEKIGPTGKLVAVEASATLTKHSAAWLSVYPQVTIVTGYAFPVWQAGPIYIEGFSGVRGSLGGTVAFSRPVGGATTQPGVYDIATLCAQYQLSPQVLVVDVEGSERILLEQPPQLPASIQYVLIELHPGLYPNGRADADALLKILAIEGFAVMKEVLGVYLLGRRNKE